MSAIATAFLTGSIIRSSPCNHAYPCKRTSASSAIPTKSICADKVCAASFEVSSLTSGQLQTDSLIVQDCIHTERLIVGYVPTSESGFTNDEALVVHGDVLANGECASVTIEGSLSFCTGAFDAPARISASNDERSKPLVLDIAYDDPTSGCARLTDSTPSDYAERGTGATAEIKYVYALIPCTDRCLLGWLDTRVLPPCMGGQYVLQTLSTSPLDGWSKSGIFQRSGKVSNGWNEWAEVLATPCA
uniref:Uncharacterized protein n=1 Tax=viral metagenome TaxID=1070528 RepID=A0A6C0C1H4_9ZZZZ